MRQAREGDTSLAEALILERAAELAEDIRELQVPLPETDGSYDLQSARPPEEVPGTMEHFEAQLLLNEEEKQRRIQARQERKEQRQQKHLAQTNPTTTPSESIARAHGGSNPLAATHPRQGPPLHFMERGQG